MLARVGSLLILAFAAVAGSSAPAQAAVAAKHPAKHAAKPVAKAAARPEAVPFIADNYARAVTIARARHVPIFVESWAPW